MHWGLAPFQSRPPVRQRPLDRWESKLKILLECLPAQLRRLLTGHSVFTVSNMNWKGLRNGRLLSTAVTESFELLLTTDSKIEFQQNLATLPLAIVVIHAPSNDLDDLEPLVPAVLALLGSRLAKHVYHVRA